MCVVEVCGLKIVVMGLWGMEGEVWMGCPLFGAEVHRVGFGCCLGGWGRYRMLLRLLGRRVSLGSVA